MYIPSSSFGSYRFNYTFTQASVKAGQHLSTKPSSWQRDEWNGCIRVCVYLILVETRRRRKAESKQASTKKLKEEFDMSCEIKQTFRSVWIQQWYMYHFVVIWYKQLTSRGGIYLKRLSLTNFFSSSALSSSPFYPCK